MYHEWLRFWIFNRWEHVRTFLEFLSNFNRKRPNNFVSRTYCLLSKPIFLLVIQKIMMLFLWAFPLTQIYVGYSGFGYSHKRIFSICKMWTYSIRKLPPEMLFCKKILNDIIFVTIIFFLYNQKVQKLSSNILWCLKSHIKNSNDNKFYLNSLNLFLKNSGCAVFGTDQQWRIGIWGIYPWEMYMFTSWELDRTPNGLLFNFSQRHTT